MEQKRERIVELRRIDVEQCHVVACHKRARLFFSRDQGQREEAGEKRYGPARIPSQFAAIVVRCLRSFRAEKNHSIIVIRHLAEIIEKRERERKREK